MLVRTSKILIIFSISLFLISCSQKEEVVVTEDVWHGEDGGSRGNHSYQSDSYKSKEPNKSSSCKLNRLCDW